MMKAPIESIQKIMCNNIAFLFIIIYWVRLFLAHSHHFNSFLSYHDCNLFNITYRRITFMQTSTCLILKNQNYSCVFI